MKKYLKPLILFLIGGFIYIVIEIVYRYLMDRPHTHWSMFVLGGLAFIIIGRINENIAWDVPLFNQVIIGTSVTTVLEFIFGFILNICLKLNVWDYSNLPFNLLGQICPQFMIVWAILVLIAIVLDDYIRYSLFGEEKPRYHLF